MSQQEASEKEIWRKLSLSKGQTDEIAGLVNELKDAVDPVLSPIENASQEETVKSDGKNESKLAREMEEIIQYKENIISTLNDILERIQI